MLLSSVHPHVPLQHYQQTLKVYSPEINIYMRLYLNTPPTLYSSDSYFPVNLISLSLSLCVFHETTPRQIKAQSSDPSDPDASHPTSFPPARDITLNLKPKLYIIFG